VLMLSVLLHFKFCILHFAVFSFYFRKNIKNRRVD
jgi:hypothetical protein